MRYRLSRRREGEIEHGRHESKRISRGRGREHSDCSPAEPTIIYDTSRFGPVSARAGSSSFESLPSLARTEGAVSMEYHPGVPVRGYAFATATYPDGHSQLFRYSPGPFGRWVRNEDYRPG